MSVNRSVVVVSLRSLAFLAVLPVVVALPARPAGAFCGFFVAGSDAKLTNNASQVVLMRKGNRTVMTMSNNYQGPLENFAMVVPVPVVLHKENVKTLPFDVFDRVDSLSAPRLVEYWEQDPCRPPEPPMPAPASAPMAGGAMEEDAPRKRDLGVKVEAKFVAGEYQIVILSATDSSGLETWLRQEKYSIPQGAAAALAPYIRDKSKFFVARVDIKKVARDAQGVVQLSPLRFFFDANELRLPVRLGLLNAGGKQDLIVYILHPASRFEVANYANTFIPTNLEVADGVRNNFPAFFAELFDATVEKMGRKVVVTEYAWQTTGCDPCPTPPLSANDLATLGLDVLEGIGAVAPSSPNAPGPGAPARRGRGRFFGGGPSWVLTRLHARYSKETLSEDLIFREAKPAMGGRANWNGTNGDEGASVSQTTESGINNFQGRYIIRHYWDKPVACQSPQYDQWGGPPANSNIRATPTAAKGLASAPRGKVVLTSEVRSPVPLLGIAGKPPHRREQKAR
jgi:hypothetical protein